MTVDVPRRIRISNAILWSLWAVIPLMIVISMISLWFAITKQERKLSFLESQGAILETASAPQFGFRGMISSTELSDWLDLRDDTAIKRIHLPGEKLDVESILPQFVRDHDLEWISISNSQISQGSLETFLRSTTNPLEMLLIGCDHIDQDSAWSLEEIRPDVTIHWNPKKVGESNVEFPVPIEFHISGMVRTESGEPLPKDLSIGLRSYVKKQVWKPDQPCRFSMTSSSSGSYGSSGPKGNQFEAKIDRHNTKIVFLSKQYATTWIGPIRSLRDVPTEGYEVVLSKGHSAKIRIVNTTGDLLEGVNVSLGEHLVSGSYSYPIQTNTNAQGESEVHLLANCPYSIHLKHPGYQPTVREAMEITPDEVIEIKMSPAHPTVGVVIDQQGEGVSNAKLICLLRESENNSNFHSQTVMATTNAQGEFILDQLKDNDFYYGVIRGPEGDQLVWEKIQAGQSGLEFQFPPRRDVRINLPKNWRERLSKYQRRRKKQVKLRIDERVVNSDHGRYPRCHIDSEHPVLYDDPQQKTGPHLLYRGVISDEIEVYLGNQRERFSVGEDSTTIVDFPDTQQDAK